MNPFCSDVHTLSLISPTRDRTTQRRRTHRKEEADELFNSFLSLQCWVLRTVVLMLKAQMSNKSIAPMKAAPVWMSGPTAESGSEERSLLTRQKNLFSNAAKQKKPKQNKNARRNKHPVKIVFMQVNATFLLIWASVSALATVYQLFLFDKAAKKMTDLKKSSVISLPCFFSRKMSGHTLTCLFVTK